MINIHFLQTAHNSSGKTVIGNILAYEKKIFFLYLMSNSKHPGNVFLYYAESYFKPEKLIFNTWKIKVALTDKQMQSQHCIKTASHLKQTEQHLCSMSAFVKMHKCMHTYLFWKGIHSQLSISTRIYMKWHGGKITHFLLRGGGEQNQKNPTKKKPKSLV